jgi:hypothetical protein
MIVIMPTMREMFLSVPNWEKFLDPSADQLLARPAEEPFGLLVHEQNRSLVIDLEDRIRRHFKEFAEACVH